MYENFPFDSYLLIFYALSNGNIIGQAFGKTIKEGNDWHFDIQHIGAQTCYLRHVISKQTIVVVYLEIAQKIWHLWKKYNLNFLSDTKNIVDRITSMFSVWNSPDGNPIQPVYSGHVYWYVDSSHGIRLMNNQVLLDGEPVLLSDILKDPILFKIFSNEEAPMNEPVYLNH